MYFIPSRCFSRFWKLWEQTHKFNLVIQNADDSILKPRLIIKMHRTEYFLFYWQIGGDLEIV